MTKFYLLSNSTRSGNFAISVVWDYKDSILPSWDRTKKNLVFGLKNEKELSSSLNNLFFTVAGWRMMTVLDFNLDVVIKLIHMACLAWVSIDNALSLNRPESCTQNHFIKLLKRLFLSLVITRLLVTVHLSHPCITTLSLTTRPLLHRTVTVTQNEGGRHVLCFLFKYFY